MSDVWFVSTPVLRLTGKNTQPVGGLSDTKSSLLVHD